MNTSVCQLAMIKELILRNITAAEVRMRANLGIHDTGDDY
jgi:hypothetical protein